MQKLIDLAESIYKGKICSDRDILKYAHDISKWETQNIEYDDNLATQIYCGTSLGKKASEVITEKKGTCNEYANLCIALLREKGIPTRYVEGFWSMGNKSSYHAWTEVYIPDFGWLPIDSMQNEIASIDDEKIRLFVGKDFEDIGHDYTL